MANDRIRLPSDSTVASQKVHRGSTPTPTQVSSNTPKEVPHPSPLSTVVLQSNALLTGKAEQLHELVLQNDPKSAPPIRVLSDSAITPGTSLLLELDENQQYRPIEKPSNDQLAKLVKLELDFWRAHLLPKADQSNPSKLPSNNALLALSESLPSVKPLVQWLLQSPNSLSGKTVQNWMQQFSPLASLAKANGFNAQVTSGATTGTSGASSPSTANQPSQIEAQQSSRIEKNTIELVSASLKAALLPQAKTGLAPAPLVSFSTTEGNTVKNAAPTNAIISPTAKLVLTANGLNQIHDSRLNQAVGLQANAQLTIATQATNTGQPALINANTTLSFSGQLFRLASDSLPATAAIIHQLPWARVSTALAQQGANTAHTTNTTPSSSNQQNPLTQVAAANLNINTSVQSNPSIQGTVNTAAPISSNTLSAATATPAATPSPTPSPTPTPTPTQMVPNLEPSNALKNLALPEALAAKTVPTELRIGLWLNEVDKLISQSPPHLSAQLKQQAEHILQQQLQSPEKIFNSELATRAAASSETDEPLLALRSWLEATQARVQNSAIGNATHQWSAPEINVQQMQLPLIWLGLTQWVDIEWYKERPNKKDKADDKKNKQQHWRMKLFLTLEPMAKICADIQFSQEQTNLTFWSQDANTLAHLNQLLPTFHSWADGLGEKTITTKHGMPNKTASPKANQSENSHLVDIRT